jgi:hypothetical protein
MKKSVISPNCDSVVYNLKLKIVLLVDVFIICASAKIIYGHKNMKYYKINKLPYSYFISCI